MNRKNTLQASAAVVGGLGIAKVIEGTSTTLYNTLGSVASWVGIGGGLGAYAGYGAYQYFKGADGSDQKKAGLNKMIRAGAGAGLYRGTKAVGSTLLTTLSSPLALGAGAIGLAATGAKMINGVDFEDTNLGRVANTCLGVLKEGVVFGKEMFQKLLKVA